MGLSVQILLALFHIVDSFLVLKYDSPPLTPIFKTNLRYKNSFSIDDYAKKTINLNLYNVRIFRSLYSLQASAIAENSIDVAATITEKVEFKEL